ncbi:hypothetical protein [Streptomyces sp. IBSBF 2806]|uniref:hypothetical protein n=1 Tax=Streptomyces sp. IBSBF 2806 TaxID=2903529 RepID=UPI002FDC744E
MSQTSHDDDPVALWAGARLVELLDGHDDPPKYGIREWQHLPNGDPRKAAAMIMAAELWRRYGDEQQLMAWFRDATRNRDALASRRTLAELNALAAPHPPRAVQAAEGWPPVAIPGRPGWYRRFVDGRQVDVQRTDVAA